VHGNSAQADTTYTYIGTYAVNKLPKAFRAVAHTTDQWTLSAGTWKMQSSTIHDEVSYVDGKVVQDEREQVAPTKAAIAELQARAIIIPTLALDADPDQFAPIGEAIGNARIVGMGEGSHGSSEFFAFKNRLFKYLVEKKGFTVFAMEANWGAGLDVDRYIKTGRGTARQAVASLTFWTWDTPEVVDLVQWMRAYNAAPGKHPILSFVGIDMQDPMGAIGYLAQYLRTHDPAEGAAARPAFQCSAIVVAEPRTKPADDCRQWVAVVGRQLTSIASAPDIAVAQQAVTNILQYLDWRSGPRDAVAQTRDQDMATNLEWVATEYPYAKIAVWAHNGHVGTTPELSYRPMGSYLRQAFGSNYYVIGQTFGGGTVRAIVKGQGLGSVSVPLNSADTLVALFAPLNATAFIDLRGLPGESALHTFFLTQHGIEEIGAMTDPRHPDERMPAVIPNSFDGLVYSPKSTATISGVAFEQMKREIVENDVDWKIAGVGFDDVAFSATSTGATVTNSDGLNATPNGVARKFDATPYIGQRIRVTAEVRTDDLLGFVFPMVKAETSNDTTVAMVRGDVIDTSRSENWIPITLTLTVPQNASFIAAGLWAEGLGSVEVRNLRIDSSNLQSATPSSP